MVGKSKRGRRGGHIFLRKTLGDAMSRNESALRLKGFFGGRASGVLFRFIGSRLGPPKHSRVELTTFCNAE